MYSSPRFNTIFFLKHDKKAKKKWQRKRREETNNLTVASYSFMT